MPSNKRFLGGLIGADPLRKTTSSRDWTPSDLTDTPYVWVDGDQGLTNLGDGGSITVTTGWTNTSTQNGLGTVGNTTNTGRFTFPQSSSINTTFALVKGDSGWTTRGYATMFSGIANISGENAYQCIGGNTTGVIDDQYTTVETWRHTRENGTQINWVSGDWGTKSTDWELYVFQSSVSDPWLIEQFGNDRTTATRHFSGHMAEILALEEELSLGDIEKIEGYLMHKWGLAANLPSGHTYKTSGPTVLTTVSYKDPGNVDRVTANVGVLSIDTAGPEDATVTEYTLADYTAYSETQLTASNNNANDRFGCGCDMSGDGTITVFGAPFEDGATNTISASGAVYVYENGTEVAILRAASPTANDSLGFDVAISKDGSTIVASAYQGDSSDGEIYVFEKPANGWADGTSSIILTHTPDQASENLGTTLAISDNGDTVVAGTQYGSTTSYSAEAFVFEKPSGGWASMTTETAKLSAASGAYGDKFSFGLAIAGDGSVIAVGAPENSGGQTESGTVYLYEKPSGGWVDATETHLLSAPSRTAYEHFGQSCSLNEGGTLLAVGADGRITDRGAVHVFENVSGTWTYKALLSSSDTPTNRHIGMAVAVSRTGTTIAASAPGFNSDEGAIYVWMKPATGWANAGHDFLLRAVNGSGANNDELGGPATGTLSPPSKLALDTDGGKVVTSSVNDDDTNTDSGSGFLFAATTTVPGSVSTTTKGSQWFWGGMRGRGAIGITQNTSSFTAWTDAVGSETLTETGTVTTETSDPEHKSFATGAYIDFSGGSTTADMRVQFRFRRDNQAFYRGLYTRASQVGQQGSVWTYNGYLTVYDTGWKNQQYAISYNTWYWLDVQHSGTSMTVTLYDAGTEDTVGTQLYTNTYTLGTATGDYSTVRLMAGWQTTTYAGDGDLGTVRYNVGATDTNWTSEFYPYSGTMVLSTETSLADTGIISLPEYYQKNWALPLSATGGDNTYDYNGYRYHEFTTAGSSTLTVLGAGEVDILLVGAGGGGGSGAGGGGAGGEVILASNIEVLAQDYTVTVGSGGAGGTSRYVSGDDGLASSLAGTGFTSIIAKPGGGGGGNTKTPNSAGVGNTGGEAYGSTAPSAGTSTVIPAGTHGTSSTYSIYSGFTGGAEGNGVNGGGGSGANQDGTTPASSGGHGGNGIQITGWEQTNYYYAAGGGGGGYTTSFGGDGGLGGGGGGGNATTSNVGAGGTGGRNSGVSATTVDGGSAGANTGSGGGGGGWVNGIAGDGGSGIVVIRYAI